MAKRRPATRHTKHEYKSTKRYSLDMKPGETTEAYYRRLAKAADQRLVRLEKLQGEDEFKSVTSYAYRKAMENINFYTPGGARFNTAAPADSRLLKEKIMDIRSFLEAPTSTKQGIIETYIKRTETFNKTNGTSFTWQELATYLEKYPHGKMKGFGYETSIKAVGIIQREMKKLTVDVKSTQEQKISGPEKEAALAVLRRPNVMKAAGITLSERQKDEIRKKIKEIK